MLILASVVLAALTYRFIENPVRHSRFLAARRWASVIVGVCLIGATLTVTTVGAQRAPGHLFCGHRAGDHRIDLPVTVAERRRSLAVDVRPWVC